MGRCPRLELSVRRAGVADADALRKLAHAAYLMYVERIGRQPAPMTTDYGLAGRSGRAWVAEQGDRLVGLLVLRPAEDYLTLENVAGAPESQGLGVGSRLLHLADEQARLQGLRQVRLYTNEAMSENLAYYPARGYRETHRATQDGFRRDFFATNLD